MILSNLCELEVIANYSDKATSSIHPRLWKALAIFTKHSTSDDANKPMAVLYAANGSYNASAQDQLM